MYVKIIESYRNVVAIADEELMGKTFTEGKKQLHIKESFYKGNKRNKEKLIQEIIFWAAEDATFNIVGEKSIQIALEIKLISKESIGKIDGIPYAMVFL